MFSTKHTNNTKNQSWTWI